MSNETIDTTAVAIRQNMAVGEALGVDQILAQVHLIQNVMSKVMKEGEHFGTIPGCGDKKTLLQPGAQKLTMTFRLCPEYAIQETDLSRGHKEYRVVCTLKSMQSGSFVGQGVGCCSTMESKYRWRGGARKCPKCGKETIIKGKAEYGGGWLCYQKKGGCGAKWPDGAAEIEGQSIERVEHDNPADFFNTVLKMAKKRAFVDATITATAASDIFTQDIGDDEGGNPPETPSGTQNAPESFDGASDHHPAATPPAKTPRNPVSGTPKTVLETPKAPTEATKAWFLKQMEPAMSQNRAMVLDYFQKVGQLLPTEDLSDLPLRFVPGSRQQLNDVFMRIADFEAGMEAAAAFPPHGSMPIEVPRDKPGSGAPDEWYMKVVVPVPHKGEKKADYLKNPDTIGSLYEAMKGGDEKSGQRLWGFANNYEANGWKKTDGTVMPPSQADIDFRKALDAFIEAHGNREEPTLV